MTTFTMFSPSATVPFSFLPTLDGAQYNAVITWGLAGQRWYVNLYDLTGNLIFYLPLIGSPTAIQTSSLTWDGVQNLVTVTTAIPHGIPIGLTVQLTVGSVLPAAYNGIWDMFATSPSTLTFPLSTFPGGNATVNGNIGRDINIAGGYFASTLVFREATQQFEVASAQTTNPLPAAVALAAPVIHVPRGAGGAPPGSPGSSSSTGLIIGIP